MKKGIEIYKKGLPHVGEKYVLGALVPKDVANWAGPFDCAEFVIWCYYQVTKLLYGCANNKGNPATADAYTGFLDRDAHKLGEIISVEEGARTAGALILRTPGDGITGHVVISDGKGGTVEAHSHADGVIKSVISGRRWDYAIKLPGVEYETAAEVEVKAPKGIIYRYIAGNLMKEAIVGAIQGKLAAWGFYRMKVDNIFGRGTFEAVRAFQSAQGLNTDGEVGPKTAAALGVKI